MMHKLKDMTNMKFGRWLVIDRANNQGKSVYWNCICECGRKGKIYAQSLRLKKSKGCRICQLTSHGKSKTKIYKIWQHMKERCYNSNVIEYKNYGGRGIKICKKWLEKFENFLEDMGDIPYKDATLDRIDNNGDYYKENCRWITIQEQQWNKTTNKLNKNKINEICNLYKRCDITYKEIGLKYNVSEGHIGYIIRKYS